MLTSDDHMAAAIHLDVLLRFSLTLEMGSSYGATGRVKVNVLP